MSRLKSVKELEDSRREIIDSYKEKTAAVAVCCGTGCSASGARDVAAEFEKLITAKGFAVPVKTRITGCHGFCEQGPLVVVEKAGSSRPDQNAGSEGSKAFPAKAGPGPEDLFYCRVKPEDAGEILETSVLNNGAVERLLYEDPVSGKKFRSENEVPFYAHQSRMLMGYNGRLDPGRIEDYLAIGGYGGLVRVLGASMKPVDVIKELDASGLRGRGGGGYPTGSKWDLCRRAEGETRYVVCNADEGDPGCFQDRSILEGNPHLVLEGMVIAAYAVGASEGYIYIRNEYPLALEKVTTALEQADNWGLLGDDILGSDFSFRVRISRGGGAFVCGEETALLSSIESLTGEPNPRPRPPYPTSRGLWGFPTLINNVKTLAAVPDIIRRGGAWYASTGTENSKGTMIFSLTGQVNNTGLVEVPMGMTLRDLIFNIGGGVPDSRSFKAVQTGGPAGGCLPTEMLDLPLDYEKLSEAGSIMGSGGMIVMDERTCMVDVARYFLSFTVEESCGKCTPCREGGRQMLALLDKFVHGTALERDLNMLSELAAAMQNSSLCALGKLAPNPVLTTLRYFEDEYRSHFQKWRCPAGVCRPLISYTIDADNCTACGRCLEACLTGALTGKKDEAPVLDDQLCTRCGACRDVCRFAAVVVE